MIRKTLPLLLCFIIFAGNHAIAQSVEKGDLKPYGKGLILPKTIIFKVKAKYKSSCTTNQPQLPSLSPALQRLQVQSLKKKFPRFDEHIPEKSNKVDLALIYSLSYKSEVNEEEAINILMNSKVLEYACVHIVPELSYTPSDTDLTDQYYIQQVKADSAWDIEKGDTNIVVGYTDTGWDTSHTDLKTNVKYNYNDPVNGIDDDGDGYTDNFAGWDVAMDDSSAHWEGLGHGVNVTGIGAAVTDNVTGIAGTGFNCKFLPVKISNAAAVLTHAYEGIVYAADQGCDIINCSWGSQTGTPYGRDIIDYATFNKNSLVVAATGNDSLEIHFYPAAYENAMAVTASDQFDKKKGNSNWGYYVDVSAPGEDMYTTATFNTYKYNGGTSMAAPVTSGAAAIVKSYFPAYNPLQIRAQLKVTTDNIDPLNTAYAGKIGTGRVNMYKALTSTSSPYVEAKDISFSDGKGNAFKAGDTVSITADFVNYLSPVSGLSATLSSASTYVSIADGNTSIGNLNTLDTTDNNSDPYEVIIASNAPENINITFKIHITNGSYERDQYFNLTVNRSYLNITAAKVKTTIGSNGKFGYADQQLKQGIGVLYQSNNSLLYEGGFMTGDGTSRVADAVRGDLDFTSLANVHHHPVPKADQHLRGLMEDAALGNRMNVWVDYKAYAYNTAPDDEYVILTYHIANNSSSTLSNVYAGLFTDWDIVEYYSNKAATDAGRKTGYAYYAPDSSLYAGIKILSNTNFFHYAIDITSGGNGGIDITDGDGYSEADKYNTMSQNRFSAGNSASNGGDVGNVVGTGPFTISPGDTVNLAFAILAGYSLQDIQNSGDSALYKYDTNPLSLYSGKGKKESLSIYPNPVSYKLNLIYEAGENENVSINLHDMRGRSVLSSINKKATRGTNQYEMYLNDLERGIYIISFSSKSQNINRKIIIE